MNAIKILAPAFGAAFLIGAAHAEPVGTMTSVEGEVFALRGNETIALSAGDELLANDRVVAREAATATIDAYGCASTLNSGAMISVNDTMCGAEPISFGYAQAEGFAFSNFFITAALIATPAIIGIAISESDDDDPVSP
ncbi:hypothetical protein [Parvularcula marina]|uniref:Uncharacterized protein n=1 Tax=Parvularcula marina TaxID=2292771 RepID=A0A371RG91_9PROT|nr:hypothetical protein [Parvularcula marina]RFB04494.1 hypothetical protein DX908_03845 [Parvularcula marina]